MKSITVIKILKKQKNNETKMKEHLNDVLVFQKNSKTKDNYHRERSIWSN